MVREFNLGDFRCIVKRIITKFWVQLKTAKFKDSEADKFIKNLRNFLRDYQKWYSKTQAVIKQVLPDRLLDFVSYFEYPRVRKNTSYANYMIRDYLQNLAITRGVDVLVDGSAAIPEFRQQLHLVEAAKDALESKLMDLTAILQADLFDTEVESARALAKAGHLRAARMICGVVIEKHLRHVCNVHNITVRRRNPVISDFNEILKKKNVITVPQWRNLQRLSDNRNLCDHAKEREPTKNEVEDLISETDKVLKSIH